MQTAEIATDTAATEALVLWAKGLLAIPMDTDVPPLELAGRLGAHPRAGIVEFGFWVPQFRFGGAGEVELELFDPPTDFDLTKASQQVEFRRTTVPMVVTGEFAWVALRGVSVGDRSEVGTLYRMLLHLEDVAPISVDDPLAASTPFGAFAPAEVIDAAAISADRDDADYYAALGGEDIPRIGSCVNLLQVHVPTATEAGTIVALTDWIRLVASKVESGDELSPSDELWLDYDGVELMPVEPTIGFEAGPTSWEPVSVAADQATVLVRRPATTNWGYDVMIAGSAAVNPAILAKGRPHELADLAAALHNFPGSPMRLVIDVVYGHADNQAVGVVPDGWFTGADMYGQHLDYRNPIVRAQLLEMQRRKANFGADGVRVDGAQDFTWWNATAQRLEFHDLYMQEMSEVVQEVGGARYRPWMIFEDGRPWPKEDWELSSTYRAVIDRQPDVHQWGPLTFAHNTPFLFTFWVSKWWRLREIAEVGANWVSGCANHDTLRRGSQVDPEEQINHFLGTSLPDIIRNAYDHAAANLLFHAFLPGTPMDFLQASVRAPWSFIRNTDTRYAIKVWAEEKRFLDWRVTDADYMSPENFTRLKKLGFSNRRVIYELLAELEAAVAVHGDEIEPVVAAAQLAMPPAGFVLETAQLQAAARAWMDDVHDYCKVPRYLDDLDQARVEFNRRVRAFRRQRRWLLGNLGGGDCFDYLHPTRGTVLFYGMRSGPGGEQLLFVANMEGRPVGLVPADLPGAAGRAWRPALITPGVAVASVDDEINLADAQGVVFITEKR